MKNSLFKLSACAGLIAVSDLQATIAAVGARGDNKSVNGQVIYHVGAGYRVNNLYSLLKMIAQVCFYQTKDKNKLYRQDSDF